MKKVLLVLASLVATTAFAGEFASLEVTPIKANGIRAVSADAVVGTKFDAWTVDVKGTVARESNTHAYNDSLQARGTYNFGSFYVRGGLGKQFVNAGNDYNFYTFAAGTKFAVVKNWSVIAEAERENAFKSINPRFNTYKVGAAYDFNKNNAVEAFWQVTSRDVVSHGVGIGYTHGF
jgi:hypothetical protein